MAERRPTLLLALMLAFSLTACAQAPETAVVVVAEEPPIIGPPQPRPKLSSIKARTHYKIGAPYRIKGTLYNPAVDYAYDTEGEASWYGPGFHGKLTANGDIYDQDALTAAHPTLPLPSMVRVTNLDNGRSLVLKLNDRGPFMNGRIIDVSRKAAKLLGFFKAGMAKVRVEILEKESRDLAAKFGIKHDPPPPETAGGVPPGPTS